MSQAEPPPETAHTKQTKHNEKTDQRQNFSLA